MDDATMGRLKTEIRGHAGALRYGDPGGGGERRPWGLRGLLAEQLARPLFAGVRSQLIALQRYAHEQWDGYRNAWLAQHPEARERYGSRAGALTPMSLYIETLPKLTRRPIYDTPPRTLRQVLPQWLRSQ